MIIVIIGLFLVLISIQVVLVTIDWKLDKLIKYYGLDKKKEFKDFFKED
jgi:hypothetical protein